MIPYGHPKLKYSSAANVVAYGNSIPAGYTLGSPSTEAWPALIGAKWPLTGTGVSVANPSHIAWTWDMLGGDATYAGSLTAFNAAYDGAKKNVVVFGETTNDIRYGPYGYVNPLAGGGTASAVIASLQTACAALLAVGSMHLVLATATPFAFAGDAQGDVDVYYGRLLTVNQWILDNYRTVGAVAAIDLMPVGSPFYMNGSSLIASFSGSGLYNDNVHPNAAGHIVLANIIAPQLARLPK